MTSLTTQIIKEKLWELANDGPSISVEGRKRRIDAIISRLLDEVLAVMPEEMNRYKKACTEDKIAFGYNLALADFKKRIAELKV